MLLAFVATTILPAFSVILVAIVTSVLASAADKPEELRYEGKIPPRSHDEIPYGPHPRNVLDFWKADTREPAPLVLVYRDDLADPESDDPVARQSTRLSWLPKVCVLTTPTSASAVAARAGAASSPAATRTTTALRSCTARCRTTQHPVLYGR